MSRIPELPREQIGEFEALMRNSEQMLGFAPNAILSMARSPPLMVAASGLLTFYLAPSTIPQELKFLISHVVSRSDGCLYGQAHTAHLSTHRGAPVEKVKATFEFETSPLFTDAERAALRVAWAAGSIPNAVTDTHFVELRKHFNDEAVVEIIGVIAVFGFLDRWHNTIATTLEPVPRAFAEQHLAPRGWEPGSHGS